MITFPLLRLPPVDCLAEKGLVDERGISLSLRLPARERRRFSGRTVSALADPRVWEEEKTEGGRHGKKKK